MNGRAGRGAAGLAVSLVAHAALGGVALLMLRPVPVAQQSLPEQRISIVAQEVPRVAAPARPPAAPALPAAAAAAPLARNADPPRSRAEALPLAATALTALAAPPALAAAAPPPSPAAALPPPPALASLTPETPRLSGLPPGGENAAAVQPAAQALPAGRPDTSRLPASPPDAPAAPAQALPAERQTAQLAAPGAGGALDPVLAETIAAFMKPGDIAASDAAIGAVRDGIDEILAGFPCARLQTGFNPDTGQLDLRGHVPDPAMRPLVLAALAAGLGPGVPVAGDLLILPRPQCQILSGIEAVGLPQSTDQFTNPRVIGADAHVRAYHFGEGEDLVLDLTAPDYDAMLYVDYFDADGQVIHLQPNEIVPARMITAKSTLTVGRDHDGQPALHITVSPPFGQEIAVAFAASVPLFEAPRPLVEPAAAYLEELAKRVAAARAADPGFKGEWVYFFIATGPR